MRTASTWLAFVVLLLLPVPVFAQASVTGTVRDASGAVTELGNLGRDPDGFTQNNAFAINGAGTAIGSAPRRPASTAT